MPWFPAGFGRTLRRGGLRRALSLMTVRRRRILAWHAMAATGVSTVTFAREALIWRVPVGDPHVGFGLFVEGGFERAKIDALLRWLIARGRGPGPGDVVVDVGANIGTTSIPIVRTCGCRAVAIEPVLTTFALLRQNVELNDVAGSIRLVNAAVVPVSGRCTMALSDNIGAAEVRPSSENPPVDTDGAMTIEVAGMSLTDALASAEVNVDDVSLVWADVQGCETAVILTGTALWARGVPLWAEFEPGLLARHGGVEAFVAAARHAFDRFIEAHDLLRLGPLAEPQSTNRLAEVLSREPVQTDVLLLPPGWTASGRT